MWIAHHCVSSFLIHCLYCCCAMRRKRGQVEAIDKRSFLIGGLRCYTAAASRWLKLRPPAQYTCSLNIPIVWSIGFSKGWRLKTRSKKRTQMAVVEPSRTNHEKKISHSVMPSWGKKTGDDTRLILFASVYSCFFPMANSHLSASSVKLGAKLYRNLIYSIDF